MPSIGYRGTDEWQLVPLLNIGSIRMYILMLDDWKLSRMKQTTDVRMYIEDYLF